MDGVLSAPGAKLLIRDFTLHGLLVFGNIIIPPLAGFALQSDKLV